MKLAKSTWKGDKSSNTQINEARKEIILKLYQNSWIKTLKENNDIIVKYLSSSNAEFVLRSFDIDSIIMTVSAIRSVQEGLGQIEKRTEEERKGKRTYSKSD